MTARRTQVKRLLTPLAKRYPDLAVVGHYLVLKPVHHIMRYVLLDGTSIKAKYRPRWAFWEMFKPDGGLGLQHGAELYRRKPPGWLYDDPNAAAELHEVIETEALPILRSVHTIEDFLALLARPDFPGERSLGTTVRPIMWDVATGRFAEARERLEQLLKTRDPWVLRTFKEEIELLSTRLRPVLKAEDRAGLSSLLREWELHMAERYKVAHLWEATPFPFERDTTE
jgi:hypothetical protein